MKFKSRKQAGFTLIELLIAISLLSAVLLLGNYSYRLFAMRWQTELDEFQLSQSVSQSMIQYHRLNEGILAMILQNSETDAVTLHFNGGPSGYVASSYNGIQVAEVPVLFEVVVEDNEDDELERLDYAEKPTDEFLLYRTDQRIAYNQPITLLDSIQNARFRYYGYTRPDVEEPWILGWHDSYNSAEHQRIPLQIEFSFDYQEQPQILRYRLMSASEKVIGYYRQANEF